MQAHMTHLAYSIPVGLAEVFVVTVSLFNFSLPDLPPLPDSIDFESTSKWTSVIESLSLSLFLWNLTYYT